MRGRGCVAAAKGPTRHDAMRCDARCESLPRPRPLPGTHSSASASAVSFLFIRNCLQQLDPSGKKKNPHVSFLHVLEEYLFPHLAILRACVYGCISIKPRQSAAGHPAKKRWRSTEGLNALSRGAGAVRAVRAVRARPSRRPPSWERGESVAPGPRAGKAGCLSRLFSLPGLVAANK